MKNKSTIVSDTWLTPQYFYEKLYAEFRFDTFDPCPPDNNIEVFNGLAVSWADRTFCNPPYSRRLKESFIHKAYAESSNGKLVVMLLPVSTSSAIFHDVIVKHATIRFIIGRLPFEGIDSGGIWANPECGWKSEQLDTSGCHKQIYRNGSNDSMLAIFDVCNKYNVQK